MATHKVSAEEDYESIGGSRNLGNIELEDVEVGVDEEYEFLQAPLRVQLTFIFRALRYIGQRLAKLEGN